MLEQPFRRNYLQHALAVSAWMERHQAKGGIDPRTLSMEISQAGRAIRFYPQFVRERDGETAFVPYLEPGVCGFVGWVPYFGKGWKESRDKLAFKDFATCHGLRTPQWGLSNATPGEDYLVKKAVSTFGLGLRGPFPASRPLDLVHGEYWEQFIHGQLVKAWYWDGELAVVEIIPMPTAKGDGKRMVAELALQALGPVAAEHIVPKELLGLQGLSLTAVPTLGQTVQLEYRYISPFSPANQTDHNVREKIRGSDVEAQLAHAGRVCLGAVPEDIRPCTAFTLDGVLDAQNRLWLLEVNCNPQLHPAFYEPMLEGLFVRNLQPA